MYCKKCGNRISAEIKFCTKCGAPVEQAMKYKLINNRRKKVICVICIIAFIIITGVASAFLFGKGEKVSTGTGNISLDNDEANKYISENFGFADNPVYGKKTAHTEVGNGSRRTTYETEINEDSNGGSIYYSTIKTEKYPNGLLCVYLSDDIDLCVEFIHDYKNDGGSIVRGVSQPHTKNKCYCMIKDHYFISVELSEKEDPSSSSSDTDNLIYEENICIYDIDNDLDELINVKREVTPGSKDNQKIYHLTKDDSTWIYAYGFGSYTANGAELVSTEQEFCDLVNGLLNEMVGNDVILSKTSWNNRWYGLFVDEGNITKTMVRVDFTSEIPYVNDDGDEITDITAYINKLDETDEIVELEEIEDNPVTYSRPTDDLKNEVIMPQNVPSTINKSELQDLRYFPIDGFWHSDDLRYIYWINSSNWGIKTSVRFADLESGGHTKAAYLKQTSSYSVILKASEDNGFSPEVFAVNNQLKSDEITLIRANINIANQLLGEWSNDETTYTFDIEGKYEVKRGDDWYWGYYFIIDENNIVFGNRSDGCELNNYSINGNTLTINNSLTLQKQ